MSLPSKPCKDRPERPEQLKADPELTRLYNLERVRGYFESHLGTSQKECARALNLHPRTVVRHVQTLREEWRHRVPSSPFRSEARV